MEVQLSKRYPVAASLAQAWAVLGDLPATAACMPGAAITESLDERHHKGTVRAKVGPAQLLFNGELELLARDATAWQLELLGKGADRAGSSASMRLKAWLEPASAGPHCQLVGEATVTVSGKLAQFGSRLLVPVSDALLAQFAQNFEKAAQAVSEPSAPQPVAFAEPAAAPQVPPLNGLALFWSVLRSWWAGLFRVRP